MTAIAAATDFAGQEQGLAIATGPLDAAKVAGDRNSADGIRIHT